MGFGKLGSLAMAGAGAFTGNPYLIASGVGGYMSADEAQRKEQQNKDFNIAQSEMTRYSPWTGMKGQISQYGGPGENAAALAGGIQGASAAQSMKGLFDKPAATAPIPTGEGTMDAGMSGNQQYQQQMQSPWMKPDLFNQYGRKTVMG